MRRQARASRVRQASDRDRSFADDGPPLTPSQPHTLKRLAADAKDRTRYLLVSVFTPRLALYYNISEDTSAMNEPAAGTLFKRLAAAQTMQRVLHGGVQILKCRVDRHGRLI